MELTYKQIVKAYKKAKLKLVTPWKTLTVLFIITALVTVPLSIILKMFDNTVAAFIGDTFWELVNEDENAFYFESDFDSTEEMAAYGDEICRQVETEGAVLLMNNNNALPLEKGSRISCFSTSSVNLVYGGTGSGNIDASKADDLKSALEKCDFSVNETLWNFYTEGAGREYMRKSGSGVLPPAAVISEAPWNIYTQDVTDSVARYGDAAVIVLSRIGGEGADMEYEDYNYLALDQNEKDMLRAVADMKKNGTVKKMIVLLNTANALQVDFLKDNEYGIDACLWIGDVGITGINAVAQILAGIVNPSGSLVDTYCYDNFSSPAMVNFKPMTYEGYDGVNIPQNASTYMIYQESIYVGYKYYETRYEDYVMGTGNAGSYVYGDDVAFAFGYGLSYTEFEYSDMSTVYNADTDMFEVTVTVTNKGNVAGKETVQVYSQSPYTDHDKQNGVEKASVALCGFCKTDIIKPGGSQTVTVYVDKRELASYDTYGAGTYILDAGEYYLTIGTDAHNAVNNTLAAKGYTVQNTDGRMDENGNADLAYKWVQQQFDAKTYSASENGTAITNQLSNADINLYEGRGDNSVTYLTRNDWEGTFPKQSVQLMLTDTMIEDLQDVQYDPADYDSVAMPVLGADGDLTLYDMIGLEYDDPLWERILDQMTFDEMVSLIGDSFHWRMPVKSIEAPGSRDENGPQGLTASLLGLGKTQIDATAFTSEDVMAATFNTELMYEVGKVIGNNCLAADIACLYGPGNNIHRTPYGGRNFEYYSEDGFLSGEISAAEVKAIQDKGIDVVMKHFALNDCEQDRIGLGVWVNEQAAREIYLKAFRAPFEKANANGVMTAYTRWGCIWSGGHYGLMTGIMREEWGSDGMSITDNVLAAYVNGVDGILAGVSTFDAMLPYVVNQLSEYQDDPVIVSAMRQACHRNLYALANSSGMNGIGADTTIKIRTLTIVTTLRSVAVISVILMLAASVLWILGGKKLRKTEQYINYKAAKKNK